MWVKTGQIPVHLLPKQRHMFIQSVIIVLFSVLKALLFVIFLLVCSHKLPIKMCLKGGARIICTRSSVYNLVCLDQVMAIYEVDLPNQNFSYRFSGQLYFESNDCKGTSCVWVMFGLLWYFKCSYFVLYISLKYIVWLN
jgi:hypothetical protein